MSRRRRSTIARRSLAAAAVLLLLPGVRGARCAFLADSGIVLHRDGGDLAINVDPLTRTPRTIRGIGAALLEIPGAGALSREEITGIGPRLVAKYADVLRIRPDGIRLMSADNVSGVWYLSYRQVADGMVVHDSSLGFAIEPGGRVESLGARLYPEARAPDGPVIGRDEALSAARGRIADYREMDYGLRSESILIYPERGPRAVSYRRAYMFQFFPGRGTHPASAAEGWAVFVDARSGRVIGLQALLKPLGCCVPADGAPGSGERHSRKGD